MAKRKKDKNRQEQTRQAETPLKEGSERAANAGQPGKEREETGPACDKGGCRVSLPTFVAGMFLMLVLGLYLGSLLPGILQQTKPQAVVQTDESKVPAQAAPKLDPELERTMAELEKRAAAHPDSAPDWVNLGNIYFDAHLPDKAIQAYEHALRLAPENADVLTDLGIMYREKGEYEKAVGAFRKAIAIEPQHQNAMFNEGVVLANDLHKHADAALAWQRLLEVNPQAKSPNGTPLADLIRKLR